MYIEVVVVEYFSDRIISLGGVIFVWNVYLWNGCGKFWVFGCEVILDLLENIFCV